MFSLKFEPRLNVIRWLALFSVWTAAVIFVVLGRYVLYIDTPSTGLGLFYLASTWVGHSFFLVLLLFIPLLILAVIFPVLTMIRGLMLLLSVFLISFIVVDSLVFDQFRFHINGFVISLLVNDKDGQIFDFSLASKLMVFAGVLCILAVQYVVSNLIWTNQSSRLKSLKGRVLLPLLFLLTLSSHLAHAYADAVYDFNVTKIARFFPVHFPTVARDALGQMGVVASAEAAEKALLLERQSDNGLVYPQKPLQCSSPSRPDNVLFILIDSWRFDTSGHDVAPNIAAFADKYATRFTNHFSGGNGTRTGVFSTFYGLPGTYWDAMKSTATPPVLITELQKQGYDLGIFTNAMLTSPAFDKTVFASVPGVRVETAGASSPARDIQLTDEWLEWLDNQQKGAKPFFGFLFYDAPHSFSPVEGYPEYFSPVWNDVNFLKLSNDFDPVPFLNRYKNAVHFTDSQIKRVLVDMEKRGLLENTMVVITGDHGQEFNDLRKNYWSHGSNFSDYQIKVPMIIAGKNFPPSQIEDKWTSHFDIAPTVIEDIFHCSNNVKDYSSGQHILKRKGRDWVMAGYVTNYGVVQKDKITVTHHTGGYEVFDRNYNPIPSDLDISVMKEVIEETSRFYKR